VNWIPVSPVRFLPYAYARAHRLLVKGEDGERLQVLVCGRTANGAINELMRVLDHELVLELVPEDLLEREIA